MNIIVTCGPSYEPIDQVRRITNFSTGRLGITLANTFADAGHRVFCLKGELATDPTPLRCPKAIPFTTNDNLLQKFQLLTDENIDAIFHAAALCDFKVANVQNPAGEQITSAKIPTRGDNLTLTLAPTTKVLPKLRPLFPNAKIVGWKYELTGTRDEAIAKAFSQIAEAHTNACVLNGSAYGQGFLFCTPSPFQSQIVNRQSSIVNDSPEAPRATPTPNAQTGASTSLSTLNDLCTHLLHWSEKQGKP